MFHLPSIIKEISIVCFTKGFDSTVKAFEDKTSTAPRLVWIAFSLTLSALSLI